MADEQLRTALSNQISTAIHDGGKTRLASVLVVIYGSEPKIIMTRKSEHLPEHGGEISFPGGKWEEDDYDLLETALRETKEELNLDISRNQVIGQLGPVVTLNSGFTIIPFITIIDDISKLSASDEVESILRFPLIPLLKTMSDDPDPNHKSIHEMYVFNNQNQIVWGASARILKQIVTRLKKNGFSLE